jgi:uncharacterized membrane protein YbhN (UPF0104 family)
VVVMVGQEAPAASGRSRTRLLVQGLLSLVLVVAIFYYLFTKIDLAQVWAAITAMTWTELAILGLLAVWNLCTYALVWMAVTPGLGFWRAMMMTQATTAVANTVPGGSAIGIGMTYSMLGSWGYSRSRTTTAVLVSGVWNSFIKLAMPVLARAAANPAAVRSPMRSRSNSARAANTWKTSLPPGWWCRSPLGGCGTRCRTRPGR